MNYIQLVQAMHRLVRADNSALGTAPNSVQGQSGILDELVFFIRQSWLDIQNHDTNWRFMWREGELTLAQGRDTITPTAISDFSEYILAEDDGRGRFLTMWRVSPADEISVRFVPYPAWQQSYLERGQRGNGQPGSFTILPDRRMRFDLVADAPYTVRVNYKRTPQELLQNSDIPIVPDKHHMAIVWWAIVNYYCTTRESANAFRQTAQVQLKREMNRLQNAQGEDVILIEGRP